MEEEIPEVIGDEEKADDKTGELLTKLADLKKKCEQETNRADDMTAVATRPISIIIANVQTNRSQKNATPVKPKYWKKLFLCWMSLNRQ